MTELNLKQITDKLNSEFASDVCKLIFWYDVNAEFADDVDYLELDNAKVLHLDTDNQFYIKHFLECEDKTGSYLIYAPFAKPKITDNHLWDTLRYSKEFFADRASLLTLDLGIDEKYKPVIKHYIKFFASKERTQKFCDLELETFNRNTIELAIMCVLCKSKTASFEEVLRCVLTDGEFENNIYLAEFEKYGLLEAFWQQAESTFGYQDGKPTLEKLAFTMFVTYTAKTLHCELPKAWDMFLSSKSGNIIAFIDSMMNSYIYEERFDEISDYVYHALNGKEVFARLTAEDIADCTIFSGTETIITDWIINRLENEDTSAKINGSSISEICKTHRSQHFGSKMKNEYFVLENAWKLLSETSYTPKSGLDSVIKGYTESGFLSDLSYRHFYYYYDQLDNTDRFENLRTLVENVYTNEQLNKLCINWNCEFTADNVSAHITRQIDFFDEFIKYQKERTVVIISDALRYEVGYSLFEKLRSDEKCNVNLKPMLSVLPSYTEFGMAALLPHKEITMSEDYRILTDGKPTDSIKQREAVLKEYKSKSRCVQYDDIKSMSISELREIFTGQDVVYIYHNQIDARGDSQSTENEVFAACEEAVNEIYALIRRLSTSANTLHFIVTADHGFIYKRDKLTENDKISNIAGKGEFSGKRYFIADNPLDTDGVGSLPLSDILKNNDKRFVSFPLASNIFKMPGGGFNYVHGGSSPQEMLVPVIDVKTEKGRKETTNAAISLVSLVSKVTNLVIMLDFIQNEPVSDIVKETTYRVYFVSADGQKISNENIHVADKTDTESVNRVFRLRFSFKNKKYDKTQKYYLVAIDNKTNIEIIRHEIVMDIAFADDFGFDT